MFPTFYNPKLNAEFIFSAYLCPNQIRKILSADCGNADNFQKKPLPEHRDHRWGYILRIFHKRHNAVHFPVNCLLPLCKNTFIKSARHQQIRIFLRSSTTSFPAATSNGDIKFTPISLYTSMTVFAAPSVST